MARKKREQPWLDRRGRSYYAFWYDGETRRTERLSLRTEDAQEARRRFAAFLVEGGAVIQGRPFCSAGLTVEAALDDYRREHVAQHVVDRERIDLATRWLTEALGRVPCKDLTIELTRYYAEQRRQGLVGRPASDGTIRRELGALVAALNHAVRRKRLTQVDVPSVELPEAPAAKDRWLSRDELNRLIGAASGRTRDFILLAYYTAARRSAIEKLTVFQVDVERGRISLNPSGRKQTKKKRPIVPIDPAIRSLVAGLVAEAKAAGRPTLLGDGGAIRKGFEAAVRRAGLEPPAPWRAENRTPTSAESAEYRRATVTPHTLRHTRATHLLQDGKSPWAVAQLLGDTLQTVVANYGHHCPDFLTEVLSDPGEELLR